jgi:hypothetical protein
VLPFLLVKAGFLHWILKQNELLLALSFNDDVSFREIFYWNQIVFLFGKSDMSLLKEIYLS